MKKLAIAVLAGFAFVSSSSFAANSPCSGSKGGIDHCSGEKFVCKDKSISGSSQSCPAYQKAQKLGDNTKDSAKESKSAASEKLNKAQSKAETKLESAKSSAKNAKDNMKNSATEKLSNVESKADTVKSNVVEKASITKENVTSAKDSTKSTFDKIKNVAQ